MKGLVIGFEKGDRRVRGSWLLLGCFLLGPLWLVLHRMWMPALIYLLIAIFTGGIGIFLLPFFCAALCRSWYVGQGWKELGEEDLGVPVKAPVRVVEERREFGEAGLVLWGLGVMSLMMLGFMAFCWWVVR